MNSAGRAAGCALLMASLACGGNATSRSRGVASEGAEGLAAPEGRATSETHAEPGNGTTGALKRCYEVELAQNPTLRGMVRVEVVIEVDGSISSVVITENTVSPTVGECVAAVMRRHRFVPGPVDGPVRRSFPLQFENGG